MAAQLYETTSGRLFHAGAVAVITVGLPARGKTHASRSLCRYMRWLGVSTKVFSVGNYRRERLGSLSEEWFDPNNTKATTARIKVADECLDDLIHWLQTGGGQVAIFDGNNVTEVRRKHIHDKLLNNDIHPLFLEFICNKPDIILANIRSVKISSPDYVGWDPEEAVRDYKRRIKQHEENYETITDTTLPFVKNMNAGEQFIVNNVMGYLQSRIVYYLMNLHIHPRTVYFARCGNSLNDNSYKADANLSPEGEIYAEKLTEFMLAYHKEKYSKVPAEEKRPLTVWTSTQKKALETAIPFVNAGVPVRQQSVLNQLNPGESDGLTQEELEAKYPEEVAKLRENPYRHRYPRAESYHDLAVRLESVIMELEREKNDVLIIAHETVLRCLYAYLFDRPAKEIPFISIPRSFMIEITPSAYGCKESRLQLP
ncbi:6-phosphofructo-2-kinase-domain-containing protein [Mycotypha africana]|uniref:6-phosphofructo-2-kinase-domain-containing protein n=1 Tax=Mycotypha africana TaxID=64632 RepID=UPI0023010955|nr:6-phosphofructo-2-kinase-domain-containing protein [Mycotypha africana]KAI8977104.1 6-phosphofructo-2-kinase-domain-containing protein [Mycotypha africana]